MKANTPNPRKARDTWRAVSLADRRELLRQQLVEKREQESQQRGQEQDSQGRG
jgi:hypothetical protein